MHRRWQIMRPDLKMIHHKSGFIYKRDKLESDWRQVAPEKNKRAAAAVAGRPLRSQKPENTARRKKRRGAHYSIALFGDRCTGQMCYEPLYRCG